MCTSSTALTACGPCGACVALKCDCDNFLGDYCSAKGPSATQDDNCGKCAAVITKSGVILTGTPDSSGVTADVTTASYILQSACVPTFELAEENDICFRSDERSILGKLETGEIPDGLDFCKVKFCDAETGKCSTLEKNDKCSKGCCPGTCQPDNSYSNTFHCETQPIECPDPDTVAKADQCFEFVCVNGQCTKTTKVNVGAKCDDGSDCTDGDMCQSDGSCKGHQDGCKDDCFPDGSCSDDGVRCNMGDMNSDCDIWDTQNNHNPDTCWKPTCELDKNSKHVCGKEFQEHSACDDGKWCTHKDSCVKGNPSDQSTWMCQGQDVDCSFWSSQMETLSMSSDCMQMMCQESDGDGQCHSHGKNEGGSCSQHQSLGMMNEKCHSGQCGGGNSKCDSTHGWQWDQQSQRCKRKKQAPGPQGNQKGPSGPSGPGSPNGPGVAGAGGGSAGSVGSGGPISNNPNTAGNSNSGN